MSWLNRILICPVKNIEGVGRKPPNFIYLFLQIKFILVNIMHGDAGKKAWRFLDPASADKKD